MDPCPACKHHPCVGGCKGTDSGWYAEGFQNLDGSPSDVFGLPSSGNGILIDPDNSTTQNDANLLVHPCGECSFYNCPPSCPLYNPFKCLSAEENNEIEFDENFGAVFHFEKAYLQAFGPQKTWPGYPEESVIEEYLQIGQWDTVFDWFRLVCTGLLHDFENHPVGPGLLSEKETVKEFWSEYYHQLHEKFGEFWPRINSKISKIIKSHADASSPKKPTATRSLSPSPLATPTQPTVVLPALPLQRPQTPFAASTQPLIQTTPVVHPAPKTLENHTFGSGPSATLLQKPADTIQQNAFPNPQTQHSQSFTPEKSTFERNGPAYSHNSPADRRKNARSSSRSPPPYKTPQGKFSRYYSSPFPTPSSPSLFQKPPFPNPSPSQKYTPQMVMNGTTYYYQNYTLLLNSWTNFWNNFFQMLFQSQHLFQNSFFALHKQLAFPQPHPTPSHI